MVDRESYTGTRGNVGRVGNFLEISLDGNCQGKKEMVDDIQSGCQFCIVDESVGDEHDHQASVLKDQCRSFPHNAD